MTAAKVLVYVTTLWLLQTGTAQPLIAAAICSSWATVQDRISIINYWWNTTSTLLQGALLLEEATKATAENTLKLPSGLKLAFPSRHRKNREEDDGTYTSAGARCGWGQVMDVFDLFPTATYYLGLDDDTFVSLPNLVTMLKNYDPDKKWYIGGKSESMFSELVGFRRMINLAPSSLQSYC